MKTLKRALNRVSGFLVKVPSHANLVSLNIENDHVDCVNNQENPHGDVTEENLNLPEYPNHPHCLNDVIDDISENQVQMLRKC